MLLALLIISLVANLVLAGLAYGCWREWTDWEEIAGTFEGDANEMRVQRDEGIRQIRNERKRLAQIKEIIDQ